MSLQCDIGDMSVEFFGKLLDEFCEMLVGYRQLYCLRDVRPIKKIHDEFRAPKSSTAEERQLDTEESMKRMLTPRLKEERRISGMDSTELQLSPALKTMRQMLPDTASRSKVAKIFTDVDE